MRLGTLLVSMIGLVACGPRSEGPDQITVATDRVPLPTPVFALQVHVQSHNGTALPGVDVVASYGDRIDDRAVTNAEGNATVQLPLGGDVSALFATNGTLFWNSMHAVRTTAIVIAMPERFFPAPKDPVTVEFSTSNSSSMPNAYMGFTCMGFDDSVGTLHVFTIVPKDETCIQADGTVSVWTMGSTSSGAPGEFYGAALDLVPGSTNSAPVPAASYVDVLVEFAAVTSTPYPLATNTYPYRKGQPIGMPVATSSTGSSLIYKMVGAEHADSVRATIFAGESGWTKRAQVSKPMTGPLAFEHPYLPAPANLVVQTTSGLALSWSMAAPTRSDVVRVSLIWKGPDGRARIWTGIFPGSHDVSANVQPPPLPSDFVEFAYQGGAVDRTVKFIETTLITGYEQNALLNGNYFANETDFQYYEAVIGNQPL